MNDFEKTRNRKILGEKPHGVVEKPGKNVVEKPGKKPNSATCRGFGARAFFGKLTEDGLYPEEGKQSEPTTKEPELE